MRPSGGLTSRQSFPGDWLPSRDEGGMRTDERNLLSFLTLRSARVRPERTSRADTTDPIPQARRRLWR
jgi:hypothetical protein